MQGAQGYWVSMLGLEPPRNPRRRAGDTPAEGRALERAGKLLESRGRQSQPWCAGFQPLEMGLKWLAGREQEKGLWWELGMAGGAFRAGIRGRSPCSSGVSGSASAPQPWPLQCWEPEQPSAPGTLPFVSENKVSAVTQPVAIPAIPASTLARQRETFLPGGCQAKHAPERHKGMGAGSTMVAGTASLGWASHPASEVVPVLHPIRSHSQDETLSNSSWDSSNPPHQHDR